ncbi:MAG: 3'-5' exonuclease, partial [Syntrophales bacterium]
KDIAILYRSNFQSRVFEEGFSKNKIPYHIENGSGFYKRREVKILLDYLRFIDSPISEEGDEALRQIINVPNRYIGRAFMEELTGYSSLKELHLYQALKVMRIDIPYVRRYVREFIAIIEPLIKDAKQIEPAEMIGVLRAVLDYDRFITDDDIPSIDDEKIANINQLQLSANRYADIKSLLTYTETFQEEISNDKNGVSLMTIHKAKGLEFPVVCLTGMISGLMPHKNGDIEEERRVAFVGASRAMKLLFLSYSLNYMGRAAKKSSFLDEMMGNVL